MLMYNSRFKVISTVEMTLKRLLYMSIAVLYLPKTFYVVEILPHKKFGLILGVYIPTYPRCYAPVGSF